MGLAMATAERWVARWERQQRRYAVGREERFTLIADVVEQATDGRDRPLVADLGCGPGSLAARLAGRLPHADIVAVDHDPLLLELGRTHHADAARYVRTAVGAPGWTDALGLDRPLDAAVSATALHCLSEEELRRTYEGLGALLRPGGVLVNSDTLRPGGGRATELACQVGRRRSRRDGSAAEEDWESWWAAAAQDPELAGLFIERRAQRLPHGRTVGVTLSRHVDLLRRAGFGDVAPVWQLGSDCVLLAIR